MLRTGAARIASLAAKGAAGPAAPPLSAGLQPAASRLADVVCKPIASQLYGAVAAVRPAPARRLWSHDTTSPSTPTPCPAQRNRSRLQAAPNKFEAPYATVLHVDGLNGSAPAEPAAATKAVGGGPTKPASRPGDYWLMQPVRWVDIFNPDADACRTLDPRPTSPLAPPRILPPAAPSPACDLPSGTRLTPPPPPPSCLCQIYTKEYVESIVPQ